jgi:hypothetical protein
MGYVAGVVGVCMRGGRTAKGKRSTRGAGSGVPGGNASAPAVSRCPAGHSSSLGSLFVGGGHRPGWAAGAGILRP